MEKYQTPELEIIEIPTQDVVKTSGGGIDLPNVPLE